MQFLAEIFLACLMAGVPIALFTLVLIGWALRGGYFKESLDMKALKQEMNAMAKAGKKNNPEDAAPQHPLQKKWAKFGGGFYGIVAFFTYIVVEVADITQTIINFGGFIDFLKGLGIGLIIEMLVEAFTNFITAMIWPVYWMGRIETGQVWIWFAAAYGGYWLGLSWAQALHQRRREPEN